MYKYIMKRITYMLLALWLVITASFFLMNTLPGNPFLRSLSNRSAMVQANYIIKWAFDQPVPYRYFVYLSNVVRGDLGESLLYPGMTAGKIIRDRLPATFVVTAESMTFGVIMGTILGIIAAMRNRTWVDYGIMLIALLGVSMPSFVMARIFQKYLSGRHFLLIGMLPTAGWATKDFFGSNGFRYSILPAFSLGLGIMAQYTRYTRTVMMDIINQDYILAAKSKGLSQIKIIWSHMVRNALVPLVTIFSTNIALVITGTFVIERIYNIPGIGGLLTRSIFERDYTMIMAATIIVTIVYLLSVLFSDLLYGVIDPRIRIYDDKK